jgi:hypothetical protein
MRAVLAVSIVLQLVLAQDLSISARSQKVADHRARLSETYGKLPMTFEANHGQVRWRDQRVLQSRSLRIQRGAGPRTFAVNTKS